MNMNLLDKTDLMESTIETVQVVLPVEPVIQGALLALAVVLFVVVLIGGKRKG